MICPWCKGRQRFFIFKVDIGREWFECPLCEGFGVSDPVMPAEITISKSQQKVISKAETRRQKERKNDRKKNVSGSE